jgi:ABC-2 type transport system permease protein
MSANIFKHEYRIRLRAVITWSVAITALVIFFFSIFPAFADQAALTNQLMAKFPQEMKDAFGLDKIDMSTVMGFFGFIFVFIQLCLAIQAGNFGFGLVSIEEAEKTADFLLTKPVRRGNILTSKLAAAICSLITTELVITVASLVATSLFNGGREYKLGTLFLLMGSMLIFQLFFLSLGLLISLLVNKIHNVTPFSLGLAFGAYVLNAFSGVLGDVKLEYITPFKHLDPIYIVKHSAFDPRLLVLNIAISVAAVAISYWLYIRRDIRAVS